MSGGAVAESEEVALAGWIPSYATRLSHFEKEYRLLRNMVIHISSVVLTSCIQKLMNRILARFWRVVEDVCPPPYMSNDRSLDWSYEN